MASSYRPTSVYARAMVSRMWVFNRLAGRLEGGTPVGGGDGLGGQAGRDDERRHARLQVLERHAREVLAVHPLELLGVEHRRLAQQVLGAERLDELLERHHFLELTTG